MAEGRKGEEGRGVKGKRENWRKLYSSIKTIKNLKRDSGACL